MPDVRAGVSGIGADLKGRMPDVNVPDVDMPDVNMPDVRAGVSGIGADLKGRVPDVNVPDVEMPDVRAGVSGIGADLKGRVPDVNVPDVDMPDVDMPDVRAGVSGIGADLKGRMPDVNVPDVNMPDVDMPDVKSNISGTVDSIKGAVSDTASGLTGDVADAGSSLRTGALAAGAAGLGAAAAASFSDNSENRTLDSSAITVETDSDASMPQGDGYPDDLTQVSGIGKVYERRLHEQGIFTWAQLAKCEPSLLSSWTDAVEAANVESWPSQAQSLAEQNNRVEAVYGGPVPSKLTDVNGIGESIQRLLYINGIYTYQQLASLTVSQLMEIVPANRRSADTNFNSWISQASKLTQKS